MKTFEFTYSSDTLVSTKVRAGTRVEAEALAREKLARIMGAVERRWRAVRFGDCEDFCGDWEGMGE